jgi:pyrroloquinoline-quinone synthase
VAAVTRDDHELWGRDEFLTALRVVGSAAYHDKHPFHVLMNLGRLNADQLRGWVANRFEYQRSIPQKDAAILANCPLRAVRRSWIRRIHDHDGTGGEEGGIEAWLRLAEATGVTREETLDGRHVIPAFRFAVEAYINLARTKPWPIAVAASLTELFAPDLMRVRLAAFREHYTWVPSWGLEYFERRLTQARVDSGEALELTLTHCDTAALQREAVAALERKCSILWTMLDAMMMAYLPGTTGETVR